MGAVYYRLSSTFALTLVPISEPVITGYFPRKGSSRDPRPFAINTLLGLFNRHWLADISGTLACVSIRATWVTDLLAACRLSLTGLMPPAATFVRTPTPRRCRVCFTCFLLTLHCFSTITHNVLRNSFYTSPLISPFIGILVAEQFRNSADLMYFSFVKVD